MLPFAVGAMPHFVAASDAADSRSTSSQKAELSRRFHIRAPALQRTEEPLRGRERVIVPIHRASFHRSREFEIQVLQCVSNNHKQETYTCPSRPYQSRASPKEIHPLLPTMAWEAPAMSEGASRPCGSPCKWLRAPPGPASLGDTGPFATSHSRNSMPFGRALGPLLPGVRDAVGQQGEEASAHHSFG